MQEVLFATPAELVVTDFEEFTGRTAAVKSIDIRARVSGHLDQVLFTDGADVSAGDVLFQIDPRSFQATADHASANVTQLEARIERMERQLARSKTLMEKENKAISIEQYEQSMFDLAEAKATFKSMIADRDLAELDLAFTRVTAPITGRISRRLVDPGNLVRADETPLATLVALDPIYAYFDVDERTALQLHRLAREGKIAATRDSQVTVQVALADETEFHHSGVVDFVDNQVDPATGTLRMRAVIQNGDRMLSPGLFVRIRFPVGESHPALLIPEEALATDQGRRFVYVIQDDNRVAYRAVKLGMLQGHLRVITEGLKVGERVAVTGLQRLRKDTEVLPKPWHGPEGQGASPVAAQPPASPAAQTPVEVRAANRQSPVAPAATNQQEAPTPPQAAAPDSPREEVGAAPKSPATS